MSKLCWVGSLLLAMSSCAGPLERVASFGEIPVGESERLWSVEAQLWQAARAHEQALFEQTQEYDSAALQAYLTQLVRKIGGPSFRAAGIQPRVRIVLDPSPFASAYPHGVLIVHTGLLALVKSEAQLAAVLAHEIAHFEGRDSLRLERTEARSQILAVLASLGLAFAVGEAVGPSVRSNPQVADLILTIGFQFGERLTRRYAGELEYGADRRALEMLEAAGYSGGSLVQVLEQFYRGQSGEPTMPGWDRLWATHPPMKTRIARIRDQLRLGDPAAGDAVRAQAFPPEFMALAIDVWSANVDQEFRLRRCDRVRAGLYRILELDPQQSHALAMLQRCEWFDQLEYAEPSSPPSPITSSPSAKDP